MKIKAFLGNFFADILEYEMWASVSRFGLVDVSTSPREDEQYLGKLFWNERKLLTLIARLLAQDDQQGAKALEGALFMKLRSRYGFFPGLRLVIRKGFRVFRSLDGVCQKYPELDLSFSLSGLKERYREEKRKAESKRAIIEELDNDISPEFNPWGLSLDND